VERLDLSFKICTLASELDSATLNIIDVRLQFLNAALGSFIRCSLGFNHGLGPTDIRFVEVFLHLPILLDLFYKALQ